MDDKQLGDGSFRFVDVKTDASGSIVVDYRLLSPARFVNTVKFRFTHVSTAGSTPKKLSDKMVRPRVTHEDPFVLRAIQKLPGGAAKLTVQILVGETTKLVDEIDLAAPNANDTKLRRDAPRLVVEINTVPRSSPLNSTASDPQRLIAMMTRIVDLLHRGVDDTAWLGPTSGRGLTLDEMGLSDAAKREEAWARRATEMMMLAPYFVSGDIYRTSDSGMYDFMAKRLDAGQESFYPVAAQCQQLCSVLLLTRGVPRSLIRNGINAGASEGLPVFKSANGGSSSTDIALKKAEKALAASPPVGPGTLYQFNPPNVPNGPGAHIGTVLRVHTAGWKALQTFDTGGLNATDRGVGLSLVAVAGGLGGGVFDDPWVQSIKGSPAPFSAVCIPGPQHEPPANLSRWWPCGFVRLMIKRRSNGELVYATPLLRMHDEVRDFPYAVLANALRGAPDLDLFEPVWQIGAPRLVTSESRVGLAEETMTQPRSAKVKDILSKANVPPDKPLKDNFRDYFLLANISANAAGTVRKENLPKDEATGSTKADRLPWGIRTGQLVASIPLAAVPPYLRGSEG